MDLSRGMCNFNPCVTSPVAAKCVVDVAIVGVATCQCPEGFAGDGKPLEQGGTGCQNINECSTGLHTCDQLSQICVDRDPLTNKGMKFECACKSGFAPSANGKSCEDIDECVQPQLNMCDPLTTVCRNFAGAYECICKDPNQVFDPRVNGCRDVDECNDFDGKRNPCDPASTVCVNQPNGVSCQCKSGFEPVSGKPTMCVDIDECALELDECQRDKSVCRNVVGDYDCQCSQELGYENVAGNNKVCGNLNECQKWPHICGPSTPCCADLAPEMGGYSCAPAVTPNGQQSYASQPPLPSIRQQERVAVPHYYGVNQMSYYPRNLEEIGEKGAAKHRNMQVSNRIPSLRAQALPGSSGGVFRRPETTTCPAGYQHVDDIARNQARQKTAEVFRTTFAGASRANPDKVASGIATNAGIIANEFATWYNSLSNLPNQVAYASQNATNINYMAGATNVMKAGEAMVVPFVPGAATGIPNAAASQIGIGNGALGTAAGGMAQTALQNPAVFAAPAAVAGGMVVGAATAGGPGDSFVLDRSGMGRLMAYDQF